MNSTRLKMATFLVMVGSYFLVLFYWAISASLIKSFSKWENTNEITVYLKPDILTDEVQDIDNKIKSPNQFSVQYFNQSSAAQYFKDQFRLGALFKNFEQEIKDIVPAFFVLEPKNQDLADSGFNLDLFLQELKRLPGVEEVSSHEIFVSGFKKAKVWLHSAFWFSLAFVIFLISFIVSNVLKSELNKKLPELRVFQLLGATQWMIRIPFLQKGVLASVAAAAVALLVLVLAQGVLLDSLGSEWILGGVGVYFYNFSLQDYVGFLLIAALIGVSGSLMALRELELKDVK